MVGVGEEERDGGLEEGGIYEFLVEVVGGGGEPRAGWEEEVRRAVEMFIEGETGRGLVWEEDGCVKGLMLR